MKLVILKTNIEDQNLVSTLFNYNPTILNWNIDTEDIDRVLRIEAKEELDQEELISLLNASGIKCEELAD